MSGAEDRPTSRTSDYGWALWHLQEAGLAPTAEAAALHASCAQARATLALVCELGANRGVDPSGPTTWSGSLGGVAR